MRGAFLGFFSAFNSSGTHSVSIWVEEHTDSVRSLRRFSGSLRYGFVLMRGFGFIAAVTVALSGGNRNRSEGRPEQG